MQIAALVQSFVSAASALLAAVFWFLSARNKLPSMLAYWDGVPETDPFFIALQAAVRLNRWAAGFAALSALKKPDPFMIDEENPEWTPEATAEAKPFGDVFPAMLETWKRGRGRPRAETPKMTMNFLCR